MSWKLYPFKVVFIVGNRKKVNRSQVWRTRHMRHNRCFVFSQKTVDHERDMCQHIVLMQHPGIVFPQVMPLPTHRIPKNFVHCLALGYKLVMDNAFSIKENTISNTFFMFDRLMLAFFGQGDTFPTHCHDCILVLTL